MVNSLFDKQAPPTDHGHLSHKENLSRNLCTFSFALLFYHVIEAIPTFDEPYERRGKVAENEGVPILYTMLHATQ